MSKAQTTTAKAAVHAKAEREAEARTRVVLWTMLAAVLSVTFGQWWLTPWLCAAPLVHAAYRRGKVVEGDLLRSLTLRWAIALVATTLIASVFVTDRVPESVPMGVGAVEATRAWLAGNGSPVWGLLWLAVVPIAFVSATVLGGGALGAVVLAALLTNATVSASVIYASGNNLIPTTLIALSPWQWAFFVGAVLAFPALVSISLGRLYRRFSVTYEGAAVMRGLIRGGALFAGAIVLRLVLSGAYSSLVSRWTLH